MPEWFHLLRGLRVLRRGVAQAANRPLAVAQPKRDAA